MCALRKGERFRSSFRVSPSQGQEKASNLSEGPLYLSSSWPGLVNIPVLLNRYSSQGRVGRYVGSSQVLTIPLAWIEYKVLFIAQFM